MDFSEFRDLYPGAEVLPVSLSSYAPGLIFKNDIFHPHRFQPTGQALVELLPFATEADRTQARNQLTTAPHVEASLADSNLDLSSEITPNATVKIANVPQQLSAEITNHRVLSFQFGNVTATTIPPQLRAQMGQLLTNLRDQNAQLFRRAIAGNFVAQTFFYADSVEITMDRNFALSATAQSALQQADPNATVKTTQNNTVVISFKQPANCPFAMDLVKGRQFQW